MNIDLLCFRFFGVFIFFCRIWDDASMAQNGGGSEDDRKLFVGGLAQEVAESDLQVRLIRQWFTYVLSQWITLLAYVQYILLNADFEIRSTLVCSIFRL